MNQVANVNPAENEIVARLFAQQLLVQAQLNSHLRIIESLARQAQLPHLTGEELKKTVSGLCDHFQRQFLLDLEKKNPALAAAVSAILDASRTNQTGLF